MTSSNAASDGGRPIEQAKQKTEQVRQDLQVAGAELHLTNSILERELPARDKRGDVRRAIDHNAVVADNVAAATEELQEVEALLEQAVVEREWLEQELARRA